jgi:hypothetical protein
MEDVNKSLTANKRNRVTGNMKLRKAYNCYMINSSNRLQPKISTYSRSREMYKKKEVLE